MADLTDRVIIEVGINEGQPRSANPHVPYGPAEIAADARDCCNAGASIVHYHGRRPLTGAPLSNDPDVNIETQRLITETTPLIAYPTYASHARVLDYYDIGGPAEERYRHIAAGIERGVKFEIGPVDLGIVDRNAFHSPETGQWTLSTGGLLNTGTDHRWLTDFCRRHGLKMSFAVFDAMHLRNLRNIVDMGWGDGPPLVVKLFLQDRETASKTLLFYLDRLRDLFPGDAVSWMPLTYGGNQLPMATIALAMGGHVRVGIGDYHYREWGCPTNAALVERVAAMARAMGREPATSDEARALLGIRPRTSKAR